MGETTAQVQSAINRFNAGDPKSLEQVFERAAKRLAEMAHRMLQYDRVHQREQTGDLVQETCIRLLRALASERISTPRAFFGLSATIIRRLLIDLARHHYGEEGSAANQANVRLVGSSSVPGFAPAEKSNDPVKLVAWREFHERVEALSQELRATFELLYYHGLTQEEAAEALGVSIPTVKRRWSDAKQALIEALGDNFPDEL